MDKTFWRATGIRCLRTFLSTILGVFAGGKLVTEIDWKFTLVSAISATLVIFITCILAGLPEVEAGQLLGSGMQTIYNTYPDESEPPEEREV